MFLNNLPELITPRWFVSTLNIESNIHTYIRYNVSRYVRHNLTLIAELETFRRIMSERCILTSSFYWIYYFYFFFLTSVRECILEGNSLFLRTERCLKNQITGTTQWNEKLKAMVNCGQVALNSKKY